MDEEKRNTGNAGNARKGEFRCLPTTGAGSRRSSLCIPNVEAPLVELDMTDPHGRLLVQLSASAAGEALRKVEDAR